jgi:DNA-binding response OmpR family regulator
LLGSTRTVEPQALRLPRKLAARSATPYVLNVWGDGYRLLARTLA